MRVLIRVDGGGATGHGHLYRMMALARELDMLGADVSFATRTPGIFAKLGRVAPAHYVERGGWAGLERLADKADVVVIDLPDPIGDTPGGVPVIIVPRSHPWPGLPTPTDFDHVIVRDEFINRQPGPPTHPPKVFVSAGGTDPQGVLPLLEMSLRGLDVSPRIANGRIDQMASFMVGSAAAVISYGMTAFECAALGIPAIYVAISEHHLAGARRLEAEGVGWCLGMADDVSPGEVNAALKSLLADPDRGTMSRRGRALIDGRGAERMARRVMEAGG